MAGDKLRTAALVLLGQPGGEPRLYPALLHPSRTGPLRADICTPGGPIVRKLERQAIAVTLLRQYAQPAELLARVDAARKRTPIAELEVAWQLAPAEPLTSAALAELLYGSATADDRDDALLAALLGFDGFAWTAMGLVRTSTEQRAAIRAAAKAHDAALAQLTPWLSALQRLRAGFEPAKKAAAPLGAVLERWLVLPSPDAETIALAHAALLALAPDEAPSQRRAAALLVELGVWDGHDDLALLRSPAAAPWPTTARWQLEPAAAALPAESLALWAIDNDAPHEIDDGVAIQRADNGWLVCVAIAAPALWLRPGDAADDEALRRGATLYHPRYAVGMLPDPLAREEASLRTDQHRPAMVVEVGVTGDGAWHSPTLRFAQVKLAAAPAYDQLDALLAGKPPRPLAGPLDRSQLDALWAMTQAREAQRIRAGAYLLYKPDVDVRAPRSGLVELVDASQISPARRIVTEAMVLACAAVAQIAHNAGIPVVYRSQPALRDPPLPPGLYHHPADVLPLFRCIAPGATGLVPAPHAMLAEPAYVQVTSPLRRYGDLAVQQQLWAWWRGQPLPYSPEVLQRRMQQADEAQRVRRGIQRKAERYFKLVWLASQRPGTRWTGYVTRPLGGGEVLVTLPQLALDAAVLARGARNGDALDVVVAAVDPAADKLELRLAPG